MTSVKAVNDPAHHAGPMQQIDSSQATLTRDGMGPVVSVIIPAYNTAAFIGETLESVFAQTFRDYEVIVVNDGSPDTPALEEVLRPHLGRILYITQENRGPSAARNTGIRAARGELIAFLDSDDIWDPDYLSVHIAALNADATIDVIYPNAVYFGESPLAGRKFMDECPSTGEVTFERLITGRCTVMTSVTARRHTIVRAGMFDESLRAAEDFDLWLRVAKQGGRIAYHRRLLVRYRRRPGSLSVSGDMGRCALRVMDKAERTLNLTAHEIDVVRRRRASYQAMLRFHEGRAAFLAGDTSAAIEALQEANTCLKSRRIHLLLILLRLVPWLLLRVFKFRQRIFGGSGDEIAFVTNNPSSHATHPSTTKPKRSVAEAGSPTGSLTATALWLVLGKLLAFAFGFAVPLLLVRRLTQSDFGSYKQVFLIVSTAMSILPLSFAGSAFYFFPREPAKKSKVALNILVFHVFVAGLACMVLLLYPQSLAMIFKATDLVDHAALIGLVVFLWTVSSLFEIVAIANGDVRLTSAYIVTAQVTKALVFFATVLVFPSVRALIGAAVIIGVLQTMAMLLYLGRRFPRVWSSPDWGMMRTQLAYTLPLGAAGFLATFQGDLPHYFVANQFGSAAYAVYAIGCFQLPIVGILSDAFGSVMIPRVSYLRSAEQREQIVLLTARMTRHLAVVYLPLCVFLLVTAPEFITLLFTMQYLDSWPIFAVNLILIPLGILACACDPVFRAYPEHLYFLVKARVGIIAALALGLWLATQHLGLVGAAAAVVGVAMLERLIVAWKAGVILGVTRRDLGLLTSIGKVALAAIAAGVAAALVRQLIAGAHPVQVLTVCGAVSTFVYLASLLALRVLTPEELGHLRRQRSAFPWNVLWRRTPS